MGYKLCPRCELNYIDEDESLCSVCANAHITSSASSKPVIHHKKHSIFMVFQGKDYLNELTKGYIMAPYYDKGGHSPSHWAMLENVHVGDIIFHGVAQSIVAISLAKSSCYDSKNANGEDCRKVDCKPVLLHNPLITKQFEKKIIDTCTRFMYQPFDKNGSGRQGYLFDLNDELAGVFARDAVANNKDLLQKLPEINDLLIL